MKPHFVAIVLATFIAPAWSATRTVTLSVPGMNCAACPITVKKALVKVAGVAKVDVSLDQREAVVTFDDTRAATTQKMTRYPRRTAGTAQTSPGLHCSTGRYTRRNASASATSATAMNMGR